MLLNEEIISEFNRFFKKARVSGEQEPTAMVLATSDGNGLVTSRTVLLKALDENGFVTTAIMSYAVKYASAYYGPFRDAADSSPGFGDRRTYQMDPRNAREALREIELDEENPGSGSDLKWYTKETLEQEMGSDIASQASAGRPWSRMAKCAAMR